MKRVEAIIKPFKLAAVRARLESLGVGGLTISEVTGAVAGAGEPQGHRDAAWGIPRLELSVVVPDARTADVVEAIIGGARTGRTGDGKVVVAQVEDVVRIRTGERGCSAI